MKTEKEKCRLGELYNANYDAELIGERQVCNEKCHAYNQLPPSSLKENIEIGENFYANVNCVMLDGAKITFGDNVFIAPNCGFYTAGHPLDVTQRNQGLEYAYPITVGNNVWIGAQVCVLPGVSIGDNSVIGAGSVVTKSIPANSVAVGNPCRVIRKLEE